MGARKLAVARGGTRLAKQLGRTLYLENDLDLAAAVIAVLESAGVVVEHVVSNAEAMARLANGRFTRLIFDGMVEDGVTTTTARCIPSSFQGQKIALSASREVLEALKQFGFITLMKPISAEALKQVICEN